MSFNELGLITPLLEALTERGYESPSSIQSATTETTLGGHDLMASAQTGTGKTAAFSLPLLQLLAAEKRASKHPRALVLTPTRELAAQVGENLAAYGAGLKLTSLVVFGGVNIGPQIKKLRHGVDVLVATPGRLLDLEGQGAVSLDEISIFVLDEADRMLDMGFIHDIKRVRKLLREDKQTLLFSATFSSDIRSLAKTMLRDPVEIDVTPRNQAAVTVEQWIHPVDKSRKSAMLRHLIQENNWQQVLVFTRTKHGANRLVKDLLKHGIEAAAIHGNKSQAQRTRALAGFKAYDIDVLVATDIASRGIDISQLPIVVNYDLPHVAEDYVHRIGRTGRAGSPGHAVSLVTVDEVAQLKGIEKLTSRILSRIIVEGFEPENPLPVTTHPKPGAVTKLRKKENGDTGGNSQRRRRRRPRRRAKTG